MVALGRGGVSYERGTPLLAQDLSMPLAGLSLSLAVSSCLSLSLFVSLCLLLSLAVSMSTDDNPASGLNV